MNRHNRYPAAEWVRQEVYLNPRPKDLVPRNHVEGWSMVIES
jgi:hypothetical protein